MNNRSQQYVLYTAQERSISRAAKRLGISQPSLSQYIQKLEEELGTLLFDRSVSPIVITEAGKIYIKAAEKIIDVESRMKSELEDLEEQKTGRLVIGASPYRSTYIMPEILARFKQRFPGIQVELDEQITTELQEAAERGAFDFAITTLPVDEAIFIYEPLMKEELVLAVSRTHPIHSQIQFAQEKGSRFPVAHFRDFAELDFVVLGEEQYLHKIFDELCTQTNCFPRKSIICTNVQAAHAMVETGIGATIIPHSSIKRDGKNRTVNYYLLSELSVIRDTVVIYKRGHYLSSPAKEMIKLLKEF